MQIKSFRKLCGPSDPGVSRVLYPDSLRAKYGGMNQEENAVYCSDLEEDGILEVDFYCNPTNPFKMDISFNFRYCRNIPNEM